MDDVLDTHTQTHTQTHPHKLKHTKLIFKKQSYTFSSEEVKQEAIAV